jgi:hypothetical protein
VFAFALFLGCAEEVSLTKPLLDFVPENATAVIKINDLAAFKNGLYSNTFFNDLQKTQTFKKVLEKVQFLDFLNPKSKSVLAFIENDAGGFESIYVVDDAPDLVRLDSIENLTTEKFDFKGISLSTSMQEHIYVEFKEKEAQAFLD